MGNSKSNIFIWLAIGSAVGVLACCCLQTAKAKMLKKEIFDAMTKIAGKTGDLAEIVKDKVKEAGVKAVSTVADATSGVAEKADMLKNKMHAAATDVKTQ